MAAQIDGSATCSANPSSRVYAAVIQNAPNIPEAAFMHNCTWNTYVDPKMRYSMSTSGTYSTRSIAPPIFVKVGIQL